MKKTTKKANVYEIITNKICDMLDKGTVPWRKPWTGSNGDLPRSLESGKTYRGINLFLLACADFESSYWLTFNQAKAKGGMVRKGEKGTPIVFFNWSEKERTNAEGETVKVKTPFLRYYTVFNLDQIDGIEAPDTEQKEFTFNPIKEAEKIVHNMPNRPQITHNMQKAFYRPSIDLVNMPKATSFAETAEYYSTLFHELTHSTGHESRLDRQGIAEIAAFGDDVYSREELVAEFGAAFLCGHSGIDPATIENSAAYIKGWSKKLRNEPRLLVTAAAQGQKAADYILNEQNA